MYDLHMTQAGRMLLYQALVMGLFSEYFSNFYQIY